ncbi:MAG: hypothetical protein OXC44_07375 [Proteobacteria bacterium]|nr:hypothetical protein [Pseudomonadota bacterium]
MLHRYAHLLHTLILPLCFTVLSTSCGNTATAPQNQQNQQNQENSQLSSVHDGTSYFLIADAKDDPSSIGFYSCLFENTEDMKDQKLHNLSVHSEDCVNAFKTSDDKPFTVDKQLLHSEGVRDFLTKNWEDIKALTQVPLEDLNLKKFNGAAAFVAGLSAIFVSFGIMGASIKFPKLNSLWYVYEGLMMVGFAGLGFGVGDLIRTNDAKNRFEVKQSSNNRKNPTDVLGDSIPFATLAEESGQTNSDEYQYFQSFMDALGTLKSESLDGVSIDKAFYTTFARFLYKLNLAKEGEIVKYCGMAAKESGMESYCLESALLTTQNPAY